MDGENVFKDKRGAAVTQKFLFGGKYIYGMKFLVTGGSGFIGSNIVWRLLSEGNEVTVLDDMSLGRAENLPTDAGSRLRVIKGDVRDMALLDESFRGAEGVFYDAARSSSPMFSPDPREGVDVNVMGFLNAMECARKHEVPVVYASTSPLQLH